MILINVSTGTVAVCATVAIAMGARFARYIGKIEDRNALRRQAKRQRIDALCHESHKRRGSPKKGVPIC